MAKKISIFLIVVLILTTMVFPTMNAARAVAIVDDAIIAIVIAALAAMGITFTMTGGYGTVEAWLRETIDSSGISFGGSQYGVSSAGKLLVNNTFLLRVRALAEYIKVELGLTDNSTVQISSQDVTINDIVMYGGLSGSFSDDGGTKGVAWEVYSGNPLHCFRVQNNTTYVLFWSRSTFQLRSSVYSNLTNPVWNSSISTAYERNESFYYSLFSLASRYDTSGYVRYNYTQLDMLDLLDNGLLVEGESLNAVAGTLDIPTDSDIGSLAGILSLPVPWGLTLGQLLGRIPGLTIEDELAGEVTLTLDDADTVADSIDQEATNAETVSVNPDDYSVTGLAQVFPFCIPFDLYNFLECLDAEPEAPAFTWRIYVPNVADEEVEVDLSEFETLAQIIRIMELLLFCVGLAFVTRKLIRG